jgi:hypothetical protein
VSASVSLLEIMQYSKAYGTNSCLKGKSGRRHKFPLEVLENTGKTERLPDRKKCEGGLTGGLLYAVLS